MIKTILVGIDGSEHARTATKYALWRRRGSTAAWWGCTWSIVVSDRGIVPSRHLGIAGFERISTSPRSAGRLAGNAARPVGRLRRARAQHTRAPTRARHGDRRQRDVERARTADLVVIGRRGLNERFSTGLLGGTGESVTRRCPKPVLITPLEFREIQRPVLAYDGSTRAASAMQYAAEFCATLGLPLTVLTVNRDEEQGRRILNEASSYLAP